MLTVAIDGPVGAGKSVIAGQLARALGILHLDSGAMYRALGLKALREGIPAADEEAVAALCGRTDIQVRLEGDQQRTILDGEDVTGQIRTHAVSRAASEVSRFGAVRRHMVALQRAYAQTADMVMDGRDIGTNVLPDATYKFFLTASPEIRAQRRHAESVENGDHTPYEAVLAALIRRDEEDSTRAENPLRQAEDAVLVDTSSMAEAEVLRMLLGIIREGTP